MAGLGGLSALVGRPNRTYGPTVDYGAGNRDAVATGDLNGDSEPDLVTPSRTQNVVSILLNAPGGQLAAPPRQLGESGLDLLGPNPARGVSEIQYAVARAGSVRLEVADVTGRLVATLFSGIRPPGIYHASWDGTSGSEALQDGVYFVRLRIPGQTFSRKLTMLR